MTDDVRQHRYPADEIAMADGEASRDIGDATLNAQIAVLPDPDRGEPAPPIASQPPELSKPELRAIVVSIMVAMFLAALDQTIVATALPTIGRQFQDIGSLSWIITAYLLSSTAVAPVYGTLSDIFGRRTMMMTALGLFLAGSILCALAPNLLTLILARALQGLGGGGILPLVQTLLSDVMSPRQRAQYQAYFSMVWVAAGIGGPVLGGVIAEHLHWSLIFWINVPLVALAVFVLAPKLKKLPVRHLPRKVDFIGGALLMAAAITFLLVLTWGGNSYAWLSPVITSLIAATLLLAGSFVWHARRTEEPFLPLRALTGPVVPYAIVAGACAIGTIVGLTVHMPMYYESVYRLTASEAGLALIPIVAMSVPGSAFAGRAMMHMTRYKWVAITGLTISACAMIAAAIATPLPLWGVLTLLSVMALGLGTTFPVSVVSLQNAVARHQVGTATGAMNFFRSLMAAITVAVFTAVLLAALHKQSGSGLELHDLAATPAADMVDAFRYVFAGAALLLATGAVSVALMEERALAGAPEPAMELAE